MRFNLQSAPAALLLVFLLSHCLGALDGHGDEEGIHALGKRKRDGGASGEAVE